MVRLKRLIDKVVQGILAWRGLRLCGLDEFPTTTTGKKEVQRLIRQLHPVCTGHELIRLGPESDGGYLVPNDLKGIEACFSPGVSTVSGFEKDCADLGMNVYLADRAVERPAEAHERFHFTKKHVGVTTNHEFMTIDDWAKDSGCSLDSDLLLQIDVEGCEYEVFLSASDALIRRFRIIVAEFHSLDQLWNRAFFGVASRAFDKILQTHSCVHIHPNNSDGAITQQGVEVPRTMELTFLRNDRIAHRSPASTFPHPLDRDNTGNATLPLPACWYRGVAADAGGAEGSPSFS